MLKRRGGGHGHGGGTDAIHVMDQEPGVALSSAFSDDTLLLPPPLPLRSPTPGTSHRQHGSSPASVRNTSQASFPAPSSSTLSSGLAHVTSPPSEPAFRAGADATPSAAAPTPVRYAELSGPYLRPKAGNASAAAAAVSPSARTAKCVSFQDVVQEGRLWVDGQLRRRGGAAANASAALQLNAAGGDFLFDGSDSSPFMRAAPVAQRRRRLARLCVRAFVLLCCGGVLWVIWLRLLRMPWSALPPLEGAEAVVVQHQDAVRRMNLNVNRKVQRGELPSWTLRVVPETCVDCVDRQAAQQALQLAVAQLRSGADMRVGRDGEHHRLGAEGGGVDETAGAVAGAQDALSRKGPHAVFATAYGPLGRIGPFLLAVRSVTDDVDVPREIHGWSWMWRTALYGEASEGNDGAGNAGEGERRRARLETPPGVTPSSPPSLQQQQQQQRGRRHRGSRPYLAVLGIPTVDNEAHERLRDSQRETWLRYSVVARSDNGFDGALLPLYIFAAKEPSTQDGMTADPSRVPQDEDVGLTVDAAAFLPTMREFSDATEYQMRAEQRQQGEQGHGEEEEKEGERRNTENARTHDDTVEQETRAGVRREKDQDGPFSFMQRRMLLREDWRSVDVWHSPCSHVVSSRVPSSRSPQSEPTLSLLRDVLGLPITPAFTAAAQYLCVASAALWQEALTHRNALWLDMLTDRRPTSQKTVGEDGGWGLPVEVGMTQKTIFWLTYAYHAFPNVPYIMKGDDDVYVKVPQFVNDMWHVNGGWKQRAVMPTAPRGAAGTAARAGAPADGEEHTYTRAQDQQHGLKLDNNKEKGEEEDDEKDGAAAAPSLTSECVYWGLLWGQHNRVPYFVGMLYLLDRRLVPVILDSPRSVDSTRQAATMYNSPALPPPSRTGSTAAAATDASPMDLLRLALLDYNERYRSLYFEAGMNEEDRFIGLTLQRRQAIAQASCPDSRVRYLEEGSPRFHDLRRGYRSTITWASVVVHRCLPADMRLLDYFFTHEHLHGRPTDGAPTFERNGGGEGAMNTAPAAARNVNEENADDAPAAGMDDDAAAEEAEDAAQATMRAWATAHLDSRTPGWDEPQPVQWVAHGTSNVKHRKRRVLAVEDGVAVYNITFRAWQFDSLVMGGRMSTPHYKKQGKKYVLLE